MQAVQAAQSRTGRDQQALARAESSAGSGQSGRTGAASSGSGSGQSSRTGATPSRPGTATTGATQTATNATNSAGTQGQGAGASSGAGSSAARLVSDEAAVASAEHDLATAEDDLTAAVLKSPVSGTVGAVGLTVGATATSSTAVVITSPGSAQVVVDVPLARMPSVRQGLGALVTAAGSTEPLDATVTAVGLLPATASTGSTGTGSAGTGSAGTGSAGTGSTGTAYPVTVLVPQAVPALATGSRAQVSLLLRTVDNALTVPTSAVTAIAPGRGVVTTLSKGVPTRTLVGVGAVGVALTQITQGLTAGQSVVLADLTAPLPTNNTNLRRFVGGGGFGGGGFGAGRGGGAGTVGGATATATRG